MTGAVPSPCDAGVAATSVGQRTAHPRWTLVACILASSLAFVDGSVINVALPTIGGELGGGAAGLQWVVNAYLLPLSALLLLGGAMGDRFGRRRMFLIGLTGFAFASVLCALAPTLPWLLAGRALQGMCAAMLMPNSLGLLGSAFTGEARGKAIGTWAAAGAIAGAVGPLIGGWLIGTVGWRAIFFINLPLAAGAIALGFAYVTESHEKRIHPLDWLGVSVATLALGIVTWGLTELSGGTRIGAGWTAAILGVAGFALFLRIEAKRGDGAIMPLGLFGTASFAGLTILTFFLYAALGALFVLLPYAMIEMKGYSPLEAGAALLPLPAAIGLASRAMGGLAAKIGSRLPLTIGPLIVAGGFALTTRIAPDASYWSAVLPAVLVIAAGMAFAVAPLTTAVMASVDQDHVGTANGFNSAVARTGGLIATALLGSVLGTSGAALKAGFDTAVLVCAGACLVAALAALVLLRPSEIHKA